VANAKWCVYIGVSALAPNMRFAYISLPGCQACAAPVYMLAVWCCAWSKQRIVRWFKKAYGRQLQRKGEGEFLRGAPRESQTHLPSKIFQRPFKVLLILFWGPCKVCQNEQYESPSSPPTPPTRQKLWETFPRPSGTEWDKWETAWWWERHDLGLETGRGQTCTAMVAYSQGIIKAIVRAWQPWESTVGPRNFETLLWWWQWRSTD